MAEVAMGVQFEALRALRQAHLGLYWTMIRNEYPLLQDHRPLEPQFEFLGDDALRPSFTLEVADSLPIQRSWFLSADGKQLIQLQTDRFVHNWRGTGAEYPRYETLREAFQQKFEMFVELVGRENVGTIAPQQVELNYVNRIAASTLGDFLRVVGDASLMTRGVGPRPTGMKFGARYPVTADGRTVARLYVEADSLDSEHFFLNLSIRGPIPEGTIEGALALFDRGREVIVEVFTELTTEPLQTEAWGRIK